MFPLVEFCMNNVASFSQEAFEKLEKDRGLDVVEYHCMGFCGSCVEGPTAYVNGNKIVAATSEELVNKIHQFMDENDIV